MTAQVRPAIGVTALVPNLRATLHDEVDRMLNVHGGDFTTFIIFAEIAPASENGGVEGGGWIGVSILKDAKTLSADPDPELIERP